MYRVVEKMEEKIESQKENVQRVVEKKEEKIIERTKMCGIIIIIIIIKTRIAIAKQ
jgi:hypothetical protein